MRFRYFLSIFIVLFVISLISIAGLYWTQMKERMGSIDSSLYTTAQILISSDVLDGPHFDLKKAQDILEIEIGKGQSEHFFLVRNDSGRVLYKHNIQASEFEYIPLEDPWHTVNHPEKYIRVLSLKFPKLTDRSLQVGVIINKEFVIPDFFSRVTLLTILITNGLGMLIAWILAGFLTRPIRNLSDFLNQNAILDKGHLSLKKVSTNQVMFSETSRDEFDQLIVAINQLIERVNRGFQMTKLWTYQMSHEIKTPLSIMNSLLSSGDLGTSQTSSSIQTQVFKISDTINAFLNWAEAQNLRPHISHYIRVSRLLNETLEKIKQKIVTPFELDIQDDFLMGINYNQMEQVLTNLLVNALHHGRPDRAIHIQCFKNKIKISNHGPPVPPQILAHLGEPFNKGESAQDGLFRGTGLGLAYVVSVCQMNDFQIQFAHHEGITSVTLDLSAAISN